MTSEVFKPTLSISKIRMNSTLKGLIHAILGAIALILPTVLAHYSSIANISIGMLLSWAVNTAFSYTVPTTTGASAQQNLIPTA